MARVVPSQIVEAIQSIFPETAKEGKFTLSFTDTNEVAAIIHLVDQMPMELIVLKDRDYVNYAVNLEAMRSSVESWQARGNVNPLDSVRGCGGLNPLKIIRLALEKCPDEFVSSAATNLQFITEIDFRENVQIDISTAEQAFRNGEWKASTVLAGSAIEALLLWRLKQENSQALKSKITFANTDKIDEWHLNTLLEASKTIGIITPETYAEADLAKNFRNLIHPGRELRLQKKCTRATALTVLASLAHVIENIIPSSNP